MREFTYNFIDLKKKKKKEKEKMQIFAEQTLDRTRRVSDMIVRSRTAASSAGGSSSPGLPCQWFLQCWSAGTGLQSRCRLLRKPTEDRHL